MEGNGAGCRQFSGKNFDSVFWLWKSFLIVDGGDVQRGVSLSTFSTSLSSIFLPYAPKPLSVYFYFADITFCDIHLCICLYPLLG